MLDALVDREDGEVSSAAEAAVVEEGAEVAQDGGIAVAHGEDTLEVVGTREGEVLGGKRLGGIAEEGVRVVAEELVQIGARAHAQPAYRRVSRAPWGAIAGAVGWPEGHRGRPFAFVHAAITFVTRSRTRAVAQTNGLVLPSAVTRRARFRPVR